MSEEINYLRKVFQHHHIGLEWASKKLGRGWNKQKLYSLLNERKDIYMSEFRQIKQLLDRHNFTLPYDYEKSILSEVSELNRESATLVNTTIEAMNDGILSKDEIADTLIECKKIEERLKSLMGILQNLSREKRR